MFCLEAEQRANRQISQQAQDAFLEHKAFDFYVQFLVDQLPLCALTLVKGAAEEGGLRETSHGLRVLGQLQTVHEVEHQVVDLVNRGILELVKMHVFFGLVRKVVHACSLQIFGSFQLNVLVSQQLSEFRIKLARAVFLLVNE